MLRADAASLVRLAVTDLCRIRIGPLYLDNLPEGRWRTLSAEERAALIGGPTYQGSETG